MLNNMVKNNYILFTYSISWSHTRYPDGGHPPDQRQISTRYLADRVHPRNIWLPEIKNPISQFWMVNILGISIRGRMLDFMRFSNMPETNFARARAAPLSVDITLYYSDPRISLKSRNRNKKRIHNSQESSKKHRNRRFKWFVMSGSYFIVVRRQWTNLNCPFDSHLL